MEALGVRNSSDVLNTQHFKGEGNHSTIQSKFTEFSFHAGLRDLYNVIPSDCFLFACLLGLCHKDISICKYSSFYEIFPLSFIT